MERLAKATEGDTRGCSGERVVLLRGSGWGGEREDDAEAGGGKPREENGGGAGGGSCGCVDGARAGSGGGAIGSAGADVAISCQPHHNSTSRPRRTWRNSARIIPIHPTHQPDLAQVRRRARGVRMELAQRVERMMHPALAHLRRHLLLLLHLTDHVHFHVHVRRRVRVHGLPLPLLIPRTSRPTLSHDLPPFRARALRLHLDLLRLSSFVHPIDAIHALALPRPTRRARPERLRDLADRVPVRTAHRRRARLVLKVDRERGEQLHARAAARAGRALARAEAALDADKRAEVDAPPVVRGLELVAVAVCVERVRAGRGCGRDGRVAVDEGGHERERAVRRARAACAGGEGR